MRSRLVFAALLLGAPVCAQDKPGFPTQGEAGCASPVGPGDDARSLLKRFGGEAKVVRVSGAEGEEMKAVVLFPKDAARRLEVIFYDDKLTQVSGYRLPGAGGKWTAAGLAPGASVAAVEAANGGPFEISGFDWDYGGYVVDFRGGKLAKLPGGCGLSIRFDHEKDLPSDLSGDGVKIASGDKRLLLAVTKVSAIMVNFPARR